MTFRDAVPADAEELTALHAAAAADLTARFGPGHWSHYSAVRHVDQPTAFLRMRVGLDRGCIVSVLRLQTKRPWAIDARYFTAVQRPLYLVAMVVAVPRQRSGLGREALHDAHTIARSWPADAIRLDAYDGAAGAGPFYAKCGYQERGRVRYKGNPLIYFELLLR